jgi:basic amino acid/polyamine antiporter, APA family
MSSASPLPRRFSLLQATALNMTNMMGVGPFITIPLLMTAMGGPQAMLGWVMALLIVIPDGLVWSELGSALPGSGGSYVYLREGYGRERWGRLAAFLFIWQFVLSGPLEIASGYIGLSQYAGYLWPSLTRIHFVAIAAAVGLLNLALLYRPIGSLGPLTIALWVGSLATVGVVIFTGAAHFDRRLAFDFPPGAFNFSIGFLIGLGGSTRIGIYDYLGYYDICYIGDEVKDPGRVLPRSIMLSIVLVAVIYFLINLSVIGIVPWREFVPASERPSANFIVSLMMEKIYGRTIAALFTTAIIWTAFASVFALLLGYSRIPYAAARDGAFFKAFGRLHPSKPFPHISLVVVGLVSIVCSVLSLGTVIDALITTRILVQFIGQIGALTMLRRQGRKARGAYRMWLYPLPSLVALAGWLFVYATTDVKVILFGLLTLVAGVLVFCFWSWRVRQWPFAIVAILVAAASLSASDTQPADAGPYQASRMSMGCLYTIEAYSPDPGTLPRVLDEAFDEVDRIDRLMSHYKTDSSLSRINREAATHPVAVEPELFDFLATALQYSRDSDGAFDITVGPLMKTWGFFPGEGRLPAEAEIAAARRLVGSDHVTLNTAARTVAFDAPGVSLDLGGIAKGYAVDRAVRLLRERNVTAALVSAGGSTIYGLGAPPGRNGWDVAIQDPIDSRRTAFTATLNNRALSVAGASEKSFDVGGVRYSHIMDPRTGRPVQGVLTVAVLSATGTAGDALDDAFFVLGPERSRDYLRRLPGTEVFFLIPSGDRGWRMLREGTSTDKQPPPPDLEALPFAPRQYVVYRAASAITVDGTLDEPSWAGAPWTEPFVDIEGDSRPQPRFRTRARMLWDDDNLYVAGEIEEPDVWSTLTERDSVIFRDNDFEIFIDPDGDTHAYYELEVNASATPWDLLLIKPYRDGGPAIHGWDIAGLKVAVRVRGTLNKPGDRDGAWTVEIALPWNILREAAPRRKLPAAGDQWRLNFSRVEWQVDAAADGRYTKRRRPDTGDPLPEDNWVWSPQGAIDMHMPERWGYVQFSSAAAGSRMERFVEDPNERVKWALRRLYYRQRRYHDAHGVYAASLDALNAADIRVAGLDFRPVMTVGSTTYEITADGFDHAVAHIVQDGRVWLNR